MKELKPEKVKAMKPAAKTAYFALVEAEDTIVTEGTPVIRSRDVWFAVDGKLCRMLDLSAVLEIIRISGVKFAITEKTTDLEALLVPLLEQALETIGSQ